MQLNDLAKLVIKTHLRAAQTLEPVKVETIVAQRDSGGYNVMCTINGVTNIVSSQRHEKRLFKSLTTVSRLLSEVGLNCYMVVSRGATNETLNEITKRAEQELLLERLDQVGAKVKSHNASMKVADNEVV